MPLQKTNDPDYFLNSPLSYFSPIHSASIQIFHQYTNSVISPIQIFHQFRYFTKFTHVAHSGISPIQIFPKFKYMYIAKLTENISPKFRSNISPNILQTVHKIPLFPSTDSVSLGQFLPLAVLVVKYPQLFLPPEKRCPELCCL